MKRFEVIVAFKTIYNADSFIHSLWYSIYYRKDSRHYILIPIVSYPLPIVCCAYGLRKKITPQLINKLLGKSNPREITWVEVEDTLEECKKRGYTIHKYEVESRN